MEEEKTFGLLDTAYFIKPSKYKIFEAVICSRVTENSCSIILKDTKEFDQGVIGNTLFLKREDAIESLLLRSEEEKKALQDRIDELIQRKKNLEESVRGYAPNFYLGKIRKKIEDYIFEDSGFVTIYYEDSRNRDILSQYQIEIPPIILEEVLKLQEVLGKGVYISLVNSDSVEKQERRS